MRNSFFPVLMLMLLIVVDCYAQVISTSTVVRANSSMVIPNRYPTNMSAKLFAITNSSMAISNGTQLCGVNSNTRCPKRQCSNRDYAEVPVRDNKDFSKSTSPSENSKERFAALIGCVAAIIGGLIQSLFSLYLANKKEKENARTAYREKVSDLADRLGATTYQLLASCDVYLKKWEKHGTDPYPQLDQEKSFRESEQKWLSKACECAAELRQLRYLLRYKLYGMDDAIKTLTRVNNWITHYKRNVVDGWKFLGNADELRKSIDQVLMAVIDSGSRPTEAMLKKVREATEMLVSQHKMSNPECEEEERDDTGPTGV